MDRDGTLIKEKHYLSDIKDIEYLPNTFEGLKKLSDKYLLIIVTNQSGVARGYFTEEKVKEINKKIETDFFTNEILITETFYCPHYSKGIIPKYSINCNCRKPKTGLIEQAIKKYKIDISESYVIGDKDSDLLLALSLKCKSILIKNNNYENDVKPTFEANDLLDAANYVLEKGENNGK